jgi:hypothetical protein
LALRSFAGSQSALRTTEDQLAISVKGINLLFQSAKADGPPGGLVKLMLLATVVVGQARLS